MSGFKPEYRNFCRSCGRDFSSVENFDVHRVGVHEYDFDWRDESKQDGRRCLSEEEMRAKGLELNARGRWHNPAASERAARTFEERSGGAESVAGVAVAA